MSNSQQWLGIVNPQIVTGVSNSANSYDLERSLKVIPVTGSSVVKMVKRTCFD